MDELVSAHLVLCIDAWTSRSAITSVSSFGCLALTVQPADVPFVLPVKKKLGNERLPKDSQSGHFTDMMPSYLTKAAGSLGSSLAMPFETLGE
jgi:hypothetical protein